MLSETDDTTSIITTSEDDTTLEEIDYNINTIFKNEKVYKLNLFVSDVVEFTNLYGQVNTISYTAINLIGKPQKFPLYGDFPETFMLVNMRLI